MASLGDNFITQCCHENAHPARGYRPNEHFYYNLLVLKMKINSEAENKNTCASKQWNILGTLS